MAEVNVASQLSYGELAKRLTPEGDNIPIFEGMNEVNPILQFIPAVPCNMMFSHRITRRTSLPSGTWRQAYKGSATKASTTQTQIYQTALLEALSEIDEDLVDGTSDPMQTRRDEDMAFTEGMSQQVLDALISGTDTTAPEQFDGLQQYLNDLSQTMVFDGGNSGGTSIYVVDFSPQTCYMIYPRNMAERGPLGFTMNTNPTGGNGKKWVTDSDSNDYLAYCTQFKWWCGFVVRDLLAIGRIANINATVGGSNTFDENDLIELLNYGRFKTGSTYILCSKEIKAQMQIKAKDKANVNFSTVNALSGEEVTMFGGYAPVLRTDSISTSESAVT